MDKAIKIWNSDYPYNLIQILNGHTQCVHPIFLLKETQILISGSSDNTLRKWTLSTYQCIKVFNDVICWTRNIIEIDNNRIIVGGKNVITIVNITTDVVEKIINDEKLNYVNSFVQLRDGNILCGCEKGLIFLYNTKINTFFFKKDNIHEGNISCLVKINAYKFLSCSSDTTIKEWKF